MKMASTYSIAEAKNHLPRLVHEVEGGRAVGLSRRGQLVAVVLSAQEFRKLPGGAGFRQALEAFMTERGDEPVLDDVELDSLRN
jgi:prevent-host-death family protein